MINDDALLSGELLSDEKLYELAASGDWMKGEDPRIYVALKELQARRRIDKKRKNKNDAILPTPCTKGFDDWTVKQWLGKINEELDELKAAVIATCDAEWMQYDEELDESDINAIVEEACDTITAITSMLEAIGITEQARQAAQRRVNKHNAERKRL